MAEKKYKKIVEHYENCLDEHGDNHKGVDWPNEEDVLSRYKVMLDVIREKEEPVSLLDFGCGAAHLLNYIQNDKQLNQQITYSGSDISQKFVELSQSKFPNNNFYLFDLLEDTSRVPQFDYIVMNGVFTEKRELSFDEMWQYFQNMMCAIFKMTNKGVAFNVMSKAVDWERDDLFHLPADLLISFLTKELTRHFVIRNDYGLYEYTVYIYKKI
jgi:SAM-dependent methyltransferase